MLKREDIRIRDPFILVDEKEKCYYMYGTTDLIGKEGFDTEAKLSAYKSKDLENFEGPFVIFDGIRQDFVAKKDYWAPEVHFYKGKYYLFGSFREEGKNRAMYILACDTPVGTYEPLSDKPVTPEDWACLDGTLWVENGKPYMIFCHEWLQVENGEICAVELSRDLKFAVSEPTVLFRASDNPYVGKFHFDGIGDDCRVTDAPFLFTEGGKLKMIWSSFVDGRYSILKAESDSLFGKWTHGEPEIGFDGGHAMIFTDLKGKRVMTLHRPNASPMERAVFIRSEQG